MNQKLGLLFIALTILLGGCSAKHRKYATYQKTENINLVQTQIEVLSSDEFNPLFLGKAPTSNTLDTSQMLYSGAAGIIGMFAQIAAQSAIVDGNRNGKISEEQRAANEVLQNYSGLNNFSVKSLLKDHSRFVPIDTPESGTKDHYIQLSPLFYLSQDRTLIELHAVVETYHKQRQRDPLYSNVIKIYAQRELLDDSEISMLVPELYNAAISYAVKDMASSLAELDTRDKSYDLSGGFERGKKLFASCKHEVVRNLRGWIVADLPFRLDPGCQVLASNP
jgi:hypothetical protein